MGITPKLLSPTEYVNDATSLIDKSKDRVYLLCLSIFYDEETAELIDALVRAAKRGVEVVVAADFLTLFYAIRNIKSLRSFIFGKAPRSVDGVRKLLEKAGVRFEWLGKSNLAFCFGRTHSKWCVVDDVVFSFGGVNLEKDALSQADYMFKVNDINLADKLVHEQKRIETANQTGRQIKNHTFKTDYGEVLFDSGQMGHSIIYRRAVELALKSEQIIYVSQYSPTGKLGEILQNKQAKFYFNRRELANNILNYFLIGSRRNLKAKNNLYKRNLYVHAKFIIFTMPDGEKIAITGSNNFTLGGSRMGTREIALLTKNKSIINQLEKFFKDRIK